MNTLSGYRRGVAAVGLVAAAALALVSNVLQPDVSGTGSQLLAALDAAGPRGAVSAVAFLLGQLPLVAVALAIAHLTRARARRSADAGATLLVVGAFGHTVFGGISLVYLQMASDRTDRQALGALLDRLTSSPAMLFSLLGLAGTVLGFLVLGISLWRSGAAPRWVPLAIWAFLVVEFVGTALTPAAAYLSPLLLGAALIALARLVLATPKQAWSVQQAAAGDVEPVTV